MRYGSRMIWMAIALAMFLTRSATSQQKDREAFDVVVYGGTSAGVTAAVQSAIHGRSVVLIEPGTHIGGLTSGGLGATDIGNKAAIGGLSHRFYSLLWEHYANDASWTWQERSQYRSRRQRGEDRAMWTFEPSVAEATLRRMLAEHDLQIVTGERLDRDGGITKEGGRVRSIRVESGRTFAGRMFVDVAPDGTFLTDELTPGLYRVSVCDERVPVTQPREVRVDEHSSTGLLLSF